MWSKMSWLLGAWKGRRRLQKEQLRWTWTLKPKLLGEVGSVCGSAAGRLRVKPCLWLHEVAFEKGERQMAMLKDQEKSTKFVHGMETPHILTEVASGVESMEQVACHEGRRH